MTFRPANPAEPPAGAQPPTDVSEQTLDAVESVIEQGRTQLEDARSSALRDAESQSERDAINARFDALGQQFGEGVGRIEQAIASGNAALLDGLNKLVESREPVGRGDAGDVADGIVSVEEVLDDAAELAGDALGAAADVATEGAAAAAEVAEDAMPRRAHVLHRKWWGG